MEIIKNDMSVDEMRFTVALLLDITPEEIKSVKSDTLIKIMNNLNKNAMAYNNLEDKYRELLQKDTYKPLNKQVHRKRKQENTEIGRQLRELRGNSNDKPNRRKTRR